MERKPSRNILLIDRLKFAGIIFKEAFTHPLENTIYQYHPEERKWEVVERYRGRPKPEDAPLGIRAIPLILKETFLHPFSNSWIIRDPKTGKLSVERD